MTLDPPPSKEDVLDALAVEPDIDRQIIERYLSDYPDYAEEIVDLAAELTMADTNDPVSLSPDEEALIDRAWNKFTKSSATVELNPFANFAAIDLKKIAAILGIKRSVLTAFRECSVIAASVPGRFLRSLAEAMGIEIKVLLAHLNRPPVALAREFKSEIKPQEAKPVSFEQLLIDAEMSETDRQRLLKED